MTVQNVVRELLAFMATNAYSQTRLSAESGVPQATISRALKSPVRLSKSHRELCKFARISIDEQSFAESPREALVQTVLGVWDGSREHAQSIARLLKAGATLESHAAARVIQPRKPNAIP